MTRSRLTLKYVSTIDIVLSRRFDVLFLSFFKAGSYVGGEHVWHTLTGVLFSLFSSSEGDKSPSNNRTNSDEVCFPTLS